MGGPNCGPIAHGDPTILRIRKSTLEARGVNLSSDVGLTDAGEVKILPNEFFKVLAEDFEVVE